MTHFERTRGLTTGQLLMTHIYGHDDRHLGEMKQLKGLLGLKESMMRKNDSVCAENYAWLATFWWVTRLVANRR